MKRSSLALSLVIISLFLFGLDRAGLLNGPRQAASGLLTPVQLGWYRLQRGVGDQLAVVTQIGSLGQDNLKLREDNDALKATLVKLTNVQRENEALQRQLGSTVAKTFTLLTTQAVGFLPTPGTKELLLSAGNAQGVSLDAAVVDGDAGLGKVISVEVDRSTLRLITDPQSKVLVVTSKGAKGLLVGQFLSSAKLTKVLQEESLNVGDTIMTTGEDGWPARLVLGEVTKVAKIDNEIFQEAEMRPLVDFDHIDTVFVILNKR